jgi:murein DD-endopeptidase MepM/ murein hydrolase activator NlpD
MRFARALAAVLILGAATVFAVRGAWPWHRLKVRTYSVAPDTATRFAQISDTLRRGETLSDLFARQGLRGFTIPALSHGLALDARKLRAGLVFNFLRAASDSIPSRVLVRTGPDQRVRLERADAGWTAVAEPITWSPQVIRLEGRVENSLYEALDAQVSDATLGAVERVRLAWDLADVYAWQLDFTRDIHPGDHFVVLVERLISSEGEVRFGRVLAAGLSVGGRELTAFRFDEDGGRAAYYDAQGVSLRRAFLRAPVEFRRISSTFSSARLHPILGTTRRHEGTDYAAAPGTPVMAAGEGMVLRAGVAGGYGNLIELRHRNGITTRYGHLRAFAKGIRAGARVTQGQVIGFVGSTGLATGPHLHYEFRVNGVARDARTVDAGNGEPIPSRGRAAFERERSHFTALLSRPSARAVATTGAHD